MKTLKDIPLEGQRVLVRVDFNVPLEHHDDGTVEVGDDTRIRAALPTINAIIEKGGKVILMSHLGRPKNGPDPRYSLRPVADYLGTLLDAHVEFSAATTGDAVKSRIDEMENGDVLVLENTRFLAGETKNDDTLARDMAALADVYVNDAFGSAHRAHASTEGVARHVGKVAVGNLMQAEVEYLGKLLGTPDKPFVAILGGAKVSDKIGVIEALLGRVDTLLIGGAMSYTFLKALGHTVGASKFEADKLDEAKNLFERADGRILLPRDHVVAAAFDNDAEQQIVQDDIPDGMMALDIGPDTISRYRDVIAGAKTIVWNGPMGVFEMPNFATRHVCHRRGAGRSHRRGRADRRGGRRQRGGNHAERLRRPRLARLYRRRRDAGVSRRPDPAGCGGAGQCLIR